MFSPAKVHHKKKTNVLELIWQDGSVSRISGNKLRTFCPCSTCRSKNVVGIQLIGDNENIKSCALMGSTGMQIIFEDGHDRGVYPWAYLRAIDEDTALDFIYENNKSIHG